MPIPFVVLEKHNPQKPGQAKRFYAQARSRGSLELKEIARMLSQRSSISPPDVVAVLEGLIELLPEKLSEGYLVKLGDFGTFRVGFSSVGEETAAQVKSKSISKTRINFRPGKSIRDELRKATFEKKA
jgi:predicted histone-like DNA-binding protein